MILNKSVVAKTRIFEIEELHLQFSNGEKRYYERSKVGPSQQAVMAVPVLDADTILLIREYAVGIEDYTLAFPKGAMKEGEDPLESANRELKEEVGYGSHDLTLIKTMSTSPSYLGSLMYVVVARNLYEATEEGDEPEKIEVVPWKLSQLDQLLKSDEFTEGRSIAAVLMLEKWLKVVR